MPRCWVPWCWLRRLPDRKSTRLNSSHLVISYAVFCLKKESINEITVRVGVSKISVSLWVRDIELIGAQVAALHARNAEFNVQGPGAMSRVECVREWSA